LAVLGDAGHMATDALGIGMSLAAITAAARGARAARPTHRTFGWYRLEILAALANSALLLGVGVFVLIEAVRRFDDPPHVPSWPVLAVGVVGLAVNLVSMALLRHGAADNLNVRGAYLEVMSDALGSVAVIVSALVTAAFGWVRADAVIGAAIGAFIVPRAWQLGRDALRVLVQAAPAHLDPQAVQAALRAVAGVEDVHDLHIWTLTSQMDVVTAHLTVAPGADTAAVLDRARKRLALEFHLTHATLQIEPQADCGHPDW
jgi:cobalt-zinc-cadmium efflux system protein